MNDKDYRLKISASNNRIMTLIERTHSSVAAFSRDHQISYNSLNALICMRAPARWANGEWRKLVVDLATALHVEPEEMFTERQLAGIPNSTVIRHVSEQEVLSLSQPETVALLAPGDIDNEIYAKQIASLVNKLPPRRREIVERYYGLNGQAPTTMEEISEHLGISRARTQELLQDALRKLRNRASTPRFTKGSALIFHAGGKPHLLQLRQLPPQALPDINPPERTGRHR